MDKYKYWIWLVELKNLGPINQKKLLKEFNKPEKIYNATLEQLLKIKGIGIKRAKSIFEDKSMDKSIEILNNVKKNNIKILTLDDELYDKDISVIDKMPIVLYYKGHLKKNDIKIGIVGSRRCTNYAKETTKIVSTYLAKNDVTVVSGMAKGIDSYAHTACLNAGGYTIAFLGSGVDICYPKEHMRLYRKIISNGAVISEYPPGTEAYPKNFAKRNFLIASFSKKLFVAQAAKRSGSLITAGYMKKQNKEILVLPNKINVKESVGTNNLILEGGTIFINNRQLFENKNKKEKINSENIVEDEIKNRIIEILSTESLTSNQLKKKFDNVDISEKLFELEFDNILKIVAGSYRLGS
jgi:DNA processing protein